MNLNDIDNISELTDEQLAKLDLKARYLFDEIVSAQSVIRNELLTRLKEQKLDGKILGDQYVSIVKKVLFTDVPLAFAKELGATKEAVDTARLRSLYESGAKIKGAKISEYVLIREVKKEKE